MSRVILVANRLPTTVVQGSSGFSVAPSVGGLASGLGRIHREREGLWLGYPGVPADQVDPAAWQDLTAVLAAEGLVPVALTEEDLRRYYEGFSNGFIWPILHSLTGLVPIDPDDFESYRAVNERFADAVAAVYRPGDLVWIHDFHLFLVPELLRRRIPDAAVGFFLHVPFPTADVFRTLPHRRDLLRGVLGADLIGFHTASYLRSFAVALAELLGLPTDIERVTVGDRTVRLGVFPIGVAAAEFTALASEPFVDELVREIRGEDPGQLMVAVDRLDYTKGVPRRLLGFERLLARHPELHERVRLLNLSVPTRESVPAYQDFRQEVDALVGRINGRFSTPRWTPIHYMFRAIDRPSLVALYRAADVMLVTPIRDGMNLVAKEFVASRVDGDGVLVLSEFAGAAADMPEAVIVNPYEVDHLADRMTEALAMPEAERRARMAGLRTRVKSFDNDWWARTFLGALETEAGGSTRRPATNPRSVDAALLGILSAPKRVAMLDYDGTLTPIVARPAEAIPDDELLALVAALCRDPRNEIHVVSGRDRAFLEGVLGEFPLWLHAEHGAATRPPGGGWELAHVNLDWKDRVRAVFEDFARVTPGAVTEVKEYGLCWHWRNAREGAERSATELALHLSQVLQRTGADVLVGNRIVEVRAHGINKGGIAREILDAMADDAGVLAAGDDATDEDLFRVLPGSAVSVRVGPGPSAARFAVPDVAALRRLLRRLAA
ncbi:MAG: bifunctional alpha,alpha-trehalose-phosphate synthase (UDP-forming)/trehalose-phosphatase [Gemmatimonadales bacterium]